MRTCECVADWRVCVRVKLSIGQCAFSLWPGFRFQETVLLSIYGNFPFQETQLRRKHADKPSACAAGALSFITECFGIQ